MGFVNGEQERKCDVFRNQGNIYLVPGGPHSQRNNVKKTGPFGQHFSYI